MTFLLLKARSQPPQRRLSNNDLVPRASSRSTLLTRQDRTMSRPKRDRWTEDEVAALPAGEHDYFDRKSGALLNDSDFREKLGKALSAFANSGGGHLVLGVEDDGRFSGVSPTKGRTSTREWLEQIIPNLVTFPLQDFRVHQVEPASASAISNGRVILIVDVGDSVQAPHQTEKGRHYYYREGGHSKLAPHFYLETLRNRLTAPLLEALLIGINKTAAYSVADGIFVETRLQFLIKNVGRIAAYKWEFVVEGTSGDAVGRKGDYKFHPSQFPVRQRSGDNNFRLDDTILPSRARQVDTDFGFLLRGAEGDRNGLRVDFHRMLSPDLVLRYRVVTETSPGETVTVALAASIQADAFFDSLFPLQPV